LGNRQASLNPFQDSLPVGSFCMKKSGGLDVRFWPVAVCFSEANAYYAASEDNGRFGYRGARLLASHQ
jgi:hypothetical protein